MKYSNSHWWNYRKRRKLTCTAKNMSQCHPVHHKSHNG